MIDYQLTVNRKNYTLSVNGNMPLLWALREELKLTGTKFGCGLGICGACTVLIDGKAVRSCQIMVSDIENGSVITIEGLEENEQLHPVQQAWEQFNVPQCGYCQSGQIMTVVALANQSTPPTRQQIDTALRAVICRCGTYDRIRKAVNFLFEKNQAK
jgi:isoquinoline 1-oxidoreductase alpha subunit